MVRKKNYSVHARPPKSDGTCLITCLFSIHSNCCNKVYTCVKNNMFKGKLKASLTSMKGIPNKGKPMKGNKYKDDNK